MRKEKAKCAHLRDGDSFPKQSNLALRSVGADENTTSYEYEIDVELCVFCSGYVLGVLSNLITHGQPT